ncbi:MAG: hypothetical protein ACTHQQ_09840, partial [Solirubrobacteraceae bacterium]
NGSTESHIGLNSGLMRDIWTDVDPCAGGGSSSCLGPLQPQINQANAQMQKALNEVARLPVAQQRRLLAPSSPLWAARNARIVKILSTYTRRPWPVTFLMIVSPLVMWLWIGGLIMVCGALISLRPLPALFRLRARAAAYVSSGRGARGLPVREPA